MSIPENYIHLSKNLFRFASKVKAEAEDPYTVQTIAGINIIGDYSSVSELFYIKPPLGIMYELHRILILIKDNTNMDSDKYVSGGALTNGIMVETHEDGIVNVMTPLPIKSINDYGSYSGVDVSPYDFVVNPKAFGVRWTLDKSGSPVFLNGDLLQSMFIHAQDDFSTLTKHTFMFQGIIHNTSVNN